jgi:hypothetical protein
MIEHLLVTKLVKGKRHTLRHKRTWRAVRKGERIPRNGIHDGRTVALEDIREADYPKHGLVWVRS